MISITGISIALNTKKSHMNKIIIAALATATIVTCLYFRKRSQSQLTPGKINMLKAGNSGKHLTKVFSRAKKVSMV